MWSLEQYECIRFMFGVTTHPPPVWSLSRFRVYYLKPQNGLIIDNIAVSQFGGNKRKALGHFFFFSQIF